eukprot:799072-Prymnesium_polylepis.1
MRSGAPASRSARLAFGIFTVTISAQACAVRATVGPGRVMSEGARATRDGARRLRGGCGNLTGGPRAHG